MIFANNVLVFRFFIFLLLIQPSIKIYSQSDDDYFSSEDTLDDFIGITKYDAFCPILDGDSVKYCGKNPCTGWIKEYYPGTDKLIHEGSYQYGQIATVFTNFFPSGKIERSFVKKANGEYYTFNVFDSIGNPITSVEYHRKIIIKRKDYYRAGVLELDEQLEKNGTYVEYQKYYFSNGKLDTELFISDSKHNTYTYREYFKTGELKIEGKKIRNPQINDYFNHGKWTYYDVFGKIIMEENYIKGTLTD